MPPEENSNNNNAGLNNFRVGLDPVFKSNPDLQKKVTTPVGPASAFNVLNNQKFTPTSAPIAISMQAVENSPVNPKSVVRTYKGDLESAIQADHLSSINIAIAENQKKLTQIQSEPEEMDPANDSNYSLNKIIVFLSVILILAGIIGISIVYIMNIKKTSPVAQVQELPSLITTEYKDELNVGTIAKDKFINTLGTRINETQVPANNLYNVYLTTGTSSARRLITASEFIAQAKFNMPDIVKRTLLPDFMVGMFSLDKNLPFVILKTSSFENTYAGMLTWETNLEKDFRLLFRLPGYQNGGGILAELTPTTAKEFNDGVIVNKDIRVLKDEKGQTILLYGIVDKETIIITVSDTAFKEIINRLNKENSLKR